MSEKLILEILNGPLDGAIVTLEKDTAWGKSGEIPLAFPWDCDLGDPQAHFTIEDDGWRLEGLDAPHGTYCINREERLTGKIVSLEDGNILKASHIWLLVRQA
jgi:hypothetical protein